MRASILNAVLLVALTVGIAQAQTVPTVTQTGTITALAQKVVLAPIGSQSTCTIDAIGTWVGTLTIEGGGLSATLPSPTLHVFHAIANDGSDAGTTITTPGIYRVKCGGLYLLQVRASAWTSGTATVYLMGSGASVASL